MEIDENIKAYILVRKTQHVFFPELITSIPLKNIVKKLYLTI